MKTAVIGEDDQAGIVYNRALIDFAASLRLPPEGLPALPGQDQGQGRTAVPLHPRGLLPRPLLPQSRRPECAARPLARHGGQPAGARHDAAGRQRSLCRGEARISRPCRWRRSAPCSSSSGGSRTRAWSASVAISTACPTPPANASSRCTAWPTRSASSRRIALIASPSRARRSPSTARGARPSQDADAGGISDRRRSQPRSAGPASRGAPLA